MATTRQRAWIEPQQQRPQTRTRDANGTVWTDGQADAYESDWYSGSFTGMVEPNQEVGGTGDARTGELPDSNMLPADFWSRLGFTGQAYMADGVGEQQTGKTRATPELEAWAKANGITPGWTNAGYGGLMRDGRPIQGSAFSNRTNDDATFIAGALGLGLAGAAANTAGLGVDAAGNATGGAFGATGGTEGLSGMDLAADGGANAPWQTGTAPAGGGYWNGTDFTGATPQAGSSNLGSAANAAAKTGATSMGTMGDWIQLGGLVNSVVNRPKPADTSGINDAARANADIAGRQQDLAEKQYADQMALFNEFRPMLTQQLQNSITEQGKSSARSDQQWNDYMATWRPVEQSLAEKSANWATPGRMEQAAQEAAGGVASQYDMARQTSREDMTRAGLDPSTIAVLEASGRSLEAKDRAGAANTARRTVEKEGMAYLDNAARFGRSMPSTGLAAAGLAGQQGQQVQSGYSGLVNATGAPAASAAPLFSSAVSANNSAGGLFGNAANMQSQNEMNSWNTTMGTLAGLNQWFGSSKTTKHVGGKVKGAANAVEKSGARKWAYKDGEGDGNTKGRMGPMAEDLKREAPEVSDGKKVDTISMLGLHHAAIGENTRKSRAQDKRLARIERQLALADA